MTARAASAPATPIGSERSVRLPGLGGATLLALLLLALVVASLLLDARSTDAERAAAVAERGAVSAAIGALVGWCGATILAFRPRHVVGRVLAATGVFWAVDGLCESYAVLGLGSRPTLPLTGLAYWVVAEAGAFLLVALPVLLVLYPTGRLPRGRWRVVGIGAVLMSLALPSSLVLAPDAVVYDGSLPVEVLRQLPGIALPLPEQVAVVVLRVGQVVTMLALPLAASVVFARHARAEGVERTQLRWLLWAAIVCLLAGGVMLVDLGGPVGFAALVLALLATSASVVIGVVRPHTGDIDALVGGTLVYGGIAAGVVALDVAVLAAASRLLGDRLEERQVTLVVLVLAVAAYGPLRSWLGTVVRRQVLGRRGERYEVVSTLAARLEASGGLADQLPTLAASVAEAFRVSWVRVEVLGPGGAGLSAQHGREPTATRTFPISYRDERIGSLSLPDGGIRGMLSGRDEALLLDVVRQAAIAVRSTLLATELQESRERLVLSREEDRRRIRRDLHDGLGPVLGGVAMRLDAAGNAVTTDPDTARRLVVQSRSDITEALADVRRLVHGLRPPALDDLGLRAAVDQQVDRVRSDRLAVDVEADELAPLPAAVEVAAYRIVSEALTNVARHAAATRCTVRLRMDHADLLVEVSDDGRGIGPDVVAGVGLRSIRERVEELGGRSDVECPARGGTRVRAWLPITREVR
ncbi:sensor histidine kinase [Knoellia locipacati]|uniref:sensor histidine kinase n=1 Tax=Knoellia locipacati TaxID=882824 RepID=UPI0011BFBDEA|nr:GAF domain-containing sensor histidine kinase [Knoellia locipacati]